MILVNGQATQSIKTFDRAVQFGDGVFETIAVINGEALCLSEHLDRLTTGCACLHIRDLDLSAMRKEVETVIHSHKDCILKIIVSRGESERGYHIPASIHPTRIVCSHDWPQSQADKPLRVGLCETRLGQNAQLAGIKHLNRLEQVLARREISRQQCDEGIVLDTQGNVIEACTSNVFLLLDGQLVTPDLKQCGIAGVVRDKILHIAGLAKLTPQIRDVREPELQQATELFFSNSLRGIQSAGEYAGRQLRHFTVADTLRIALIKQHAIPAQ